MRLCIFTHTFPRFPGDTAAPFMGNIAEILAKFGHEVVVLVPFDRQLNTRVKRPYKLITYKYVFPDFLHTLGYSRTLEGDRKLKPIAYLLSPLLFFFGFFALLRLVKKEKIEVISSHWIIPNGFIAALVSKTTGTPFIVTIPGSDIYLGAKNKIFKWMVLFAAKAAHVVLSDNAQYLSQLFVLGFKPEITDIIPYGVDPEKFKPQPKDKKILSKLGLKITDPVVLCVGRLVAKKGFIYLVRAFPTVLKRIPNSKLLIVGEGSEKQQLVREIDKLNIGSSVIFAGTVPYDQLSKYYNIGDLFIMPSIKDENGNIDASPVAMMEAMACGTPVVATRFAATEEIIEDEETGFLVKEKDSRDLAKAIFTLLNKRRRTIITKKIREAAIHNFSTTAVAKKYTKVFELALLRHRD